MKSLLNYSAFADESPGIPPKLKQFKALTQKLSSTTCRRLLGLAVFTTVLSMTSNALANYMRYGAYGPGVTQVQAALGIPADGVFGSQTRYAVMDFQRSCGLAVDGIVGPETWNALFSGCSSGVAVAPAVSPTYTPVSAANNILEPGIKPPSSVLPPAVTGPYVVIVPGADAQKLAAVQQIVPNSVIDGALPGSFINAGGYPNYSSAREIAGRLRGYGFDARVDYFEYYEPADDPPGGVNSRACTSGTSSC